MTKFDINSKKFSMLAIDIIIHQGSAKLNISNDKL